jgi:hypothetical protein
MSWRSKLTVHVTAVGECSPAELLSVGSELALRQIASTLGKCVSSALPTPGHSYFQLGVESTFSTASCSPVSCGRSPWVPNPGQHAAQ